LTRQIETPEREILSFLTRAWSENKKAKFRWAKPDIFQCDTEKETIHITNIQNYETYPKLTGFSRWRIWRFLTFHESMHLKHGPKLLPHAYLESVALSELKEYKHLENLYRLFEDVRIEELGLKTYVGYIPEQNYYNAIAFAEQKKPLKENVLRLRKKLSLNKNDAQAQFELWWNAFTLQVLFHKKIIKIDSSLRPDTDHFVAEVYSLKGINDSVHLAIKVCEWINQRFPQGTSIHLDDRPIKLMLSGESLDASPDVITKTLDELGIKPEDKKDILSGTEDIQGEYKNIELKTEEDKKQDDSDSIIDAYSHGVPSARDAIALIPEIKTEQWDDLMNQAGAIITSLKSQLRRWKVGYKEVLAEEGEDLDAEAPIISRLHKNDDRPKIFLDEQKIGSKGKLLVLIDMSGSIQSTQEAYLRSGGIIAEALTAIGAEFELYCFNKQRIDPAVDIVNPILWLIKTFGEHWSTEQKERLANMTARGDTPLHNVLRLVFARAKKLNVKRLVILTDGNPDSVDEATKEIRKLTHEGIRVLFLRVRNASIEFMKRMLDFKNTSERVRYIDELTELPRAFFELLQSSV